MNRHSRKNLNVIYRIDHLSLLVRRRLFRCNIKCITFALGTVIAAGPGRVHPETGILITIAVAEGENVIYGKYDGNIVI